MFNYSINGSDKFFGLTNGFNYNIVFGSISKKHDFVEEITKNRLPQPEPGMAVKSDNLDHLIKPVSMLLEKYASVEGIKGIEVTNLDTSMEHSLTHAHIDSDEYGESKSLFLYPHVSKTLEGGRMIIMNDQFNPFFLSILVKNVNRLFGSEICSWETRFDDQNNENEEVLIINTKLDDNDHIVYIAMGGYVIHQFEPHSGEGNIESIFISFEGSLKEVVQE